MKKPFPLRNAIVPLHTVGWMIFGAILGAEAVFFATQTQFSIVVLLLAIMNYALFSLIWGVGYAMGAYQASQPANDQEDTEETTDQQ